MYTTELNVYGNMSSEFKFLVTDSNCRTLLDGLITGRLTDFWVNNLFQSNSDYLVKIMYYPVNLDNFVDYTYTADGGILVGKKVSSAMGRFQIKPTVPMVKILSFDLRSYKLNNFLDYSPYTKISLHIPLFAPIDLQPEIVYKMAVLEVYMTLDLTNGKSMIYVQGRQSGSSENVLVASESAQIGIDIAMGKTNKEEQDRNNALQSISFIGNIGGLLIGGASGNPLITAGSVNMLSKNTTQLLANSIDRLTSYKGSSGDRNALMVDRRMYLIIERPKNIKQPSNELKGRVLNETRTLNTINGYTEVSEIHFNPFDAIITDKEINEIVELLRTGVIL